MAHDIRTALRFELYKRDFQLMALEQLKIKGAAPGQILPLDIRVKPLQEQIWNKAKKQLATQGYVRGRVLKGRQQGASSGTQGLMYWKTSTTSNFDSLLMAHDGPTTQRLFSIARHFYDNVHPSYRPLIRYSSKSELQFANPDPRTRYQNPGLSSQMDFVDASRKFPGTSLTRHGLHTTESAKYPEDSTHIIASSLLPMLHDLPGTFHIDESTAFVTGDWFRAGCDEARSGKSRYFWVFSPWYADPEYRLPLDKGEKFVMTREERRIVKFAAKGQKLDEVAPHDITPEQLKWRRHKIREFELAGISSNGGEWFNQEFPLDYESSWLSVDLFVFDRHAIATLRQKTPQPNLLNVVPGSPPRTRLARNEHFDLESDYHAVWHMPEPGRYYDLGVDVSAGVEGGDWSVIQIVERFTLRQCAEIHLRCDGVDLAEEIYWWGALYNWGQVAVEYNAEGITVGQFLQRKDYPNLYFWRNRGGAYPKVTGLIGWKTSRESKRFMIANFRSKMARNEVEINSRWLLAEMSNYIQIPSGDAEWTYRAQTGHDDRVMSFGITIVTSDDEAAGVAPEADRSIARQPQIAPLDVSISDFADRQLGNEMKRRIARGLGIAQYEDEW